MNTYLDLARQGKNDWWRYVLAVLSILFLWQIVGAGPTLLLMLWVTLDGNPATAFHFDGTFSGMSVNLSFTATMLASWTFIAGIFLAVRVIHGRRLLTLVTPARSIDWKRLFQGFGLWFALSTLIAVLEALTHPGRYVLTLDLPRYIPFVFLALFLIPIQTTAEELFFRGYVLQGFGLRIRNIWVLSALSGILFGLPHLLNPEAKLNYGLMGLSYFFTGAVLVYVTLRDGRLELALGLHAANNLFTALFANAVVTAMPTPSLFTIQVLDVGYSVSTIMIALVAFALVFRGPLKEKTDRVNE